MNKKEIEELEANINSIVENRNFDSKFIDTYERLVPSDILDKCHSEIKESNLSEETKLLVIAQLIDYNNMYNEYIKNLYIDFMYNSLLFIRSFERYGDHVINPPARSDGRYGKILGLISELLVQFEDIKCVSDSDFDDFLKKYLNTDLALIKSTIVSKVVIYEIEEESRKSLFDCNNKFYEKLKRSVEYSFNQEEYKLENIINDTFYIKDFLKLEDK